MTHQFIYKPEVLVEMAQEYLQAEADFREFIRQHSDSFGLRLKTPEDERWYLVKDKESSCTMSALCDACRLVNADVDVVLATAKAMNRYERRRRWQVYAHLPNGWCRFCGEFGEDGGDRVRHFFSTPDPDADYFQSTGRRHPWAA